MKISFKATILYSLPFILTVIAAFGFDILNSLDLFYGYLLIAIFTFFIPVAVFCSPYALYFFILSKLNKISKMGAVIAFVFTMIGFIGIIVGVEKLYKPIEQKLYFNEQTTIELEKRSLKRFKMDTGLEGEIKNSKPISRKGSWDEGDMSGIEERKYTFIVVTRDSSKQFVKRQYTFTYKYGGWSGV
ncbi:hypothetical protein [Gottfriedia solisilvae]|uniref:Uncharacterized protein n=1 Tax=Gottfriedia solisilvae TaxID=1516104 RepID=A0A8J3AL17_9BACI|nr:hypothetical protein [Gottfriedia solisilvae]GGI12887.1 hypothetical protein GCM10007380_15160 [Gottfriedia solisilvae]